MQRFVLAAAAALALSSAPAFAQAGQPLTITEVDHVGNRITVSGPGMEDRIIDLDDAAISSGARRIRVGDLQAGDQVVVDGTVSGPRLDARSVRVVAPSSPSPPPSVGAGDDTFVPPDTSPATPEPTPPPSGSTTMQPGAPIPPPESGGAGRP